MHRNRLAVWSTAVPILTGAVLTAVLASAPASRLLGYPLIEDGFYSLSIARQIGLGHGITIDGTMWTNGFQPLWVFLLAPVYLLTGGSRLMALRAVLVCSAAVWLLTAWALAELAARARPTAARQIRVWTVVLYLTSTTIFEQHFNGLETGLLLLVFAVLGLAAGHRTWSGVRMVLVGILSGLLVLTRIDTALFVALFSSAMLCFPRGEALRSRVRRTAAVVVGSALVSCPWWLYNVRRFGSLMPSSGSSEFDWHWRPGRALVLGLYAAGHAVPLAIQPFWPRSYGWWAAIALILAGVTAIVRTRGRIVGRAVTLLDDHPLAPFAAALLAYMALLILVYAMNPAWWMYQRYTVPVVVLSVPAVAAAAARVFSERATAVIAPLAALCLVLGVRANLRSPDNGNYQAQLQLALTHVPDAASVGALQSGTLGYLRDRVVNLDGKVNPAALRARNDLDDYTRGIGLDWVVDWPWLLHSEFGSLDAWQVVDRANVPGCDSCEFVLYRRRPPSPGR
ncbi:MAG: hypothetical protein ACRD1V_18965 [Vicinamibacterales bacterium]